MNYQQAIAVPILFELAQGGVSLERGYSDTDSFHDKVAKWFPSKSSQLKCETVTDGSQTKLYNSIRQGIRKLANWQPPPVNWIRRKRLAINPAGLSHLQRVIVAAEGGTSIANAIDTTAISKLSLEEFTRFVRQNCSALRPLLTAHVRAMYRLR